MLPPKVKEAIEKEIQLPVNKDRIYSYRLGFEDGIHKGAEIALRTPPDGELVEEMEKYLDNSEQAFALDNEGTVIEIKDAAELCAAVAHRHMAVLRAENERLEAVATSEGLLNEFMESKDYRNVDPNNRILGFLQWFDKHYSAMPKIKKP